MTHIEGVLKDYSLGTDTIIFTLKGYDGNTYEAGINIKDLLDKTIKNEKVGIILFEEGDDIVNIRGVAKSLPLTAKYSSNF